jgi:hypothetical protein
MQEPEPIPISGLNDDTYVVDDVGDTIIEEAGWAGTDTVRSISYTLGVRLENLTLTGAILFAALGTTRTIVSMGPCRDGANVLAGSLGDTYLLGVGIASSKTSMKALIP